MHKLRMVILFHLENMEQLLVHNHSVQRIIVMDKRPENDAMVSVDHF